jgi:tRNA threonylcarbamoyladenosine biosynthesis protein TsaE
LKGTVYISNSEEETEKIASDIAKKIPYGTCIGLRGNLGAGKTVFARGFARGLNIDDVVSSPTFTLVKEYQASDDQWLYHLDLYRISDVEAALVFGIDEYLNDTNAIVLIEWPERIYELFTPDSIIIDIERTGRDTRKISVREKSNTNHSN